MMRFGWIAFLPFLLVILFSSCDGPSGVDGKDAEDFDHYPPEISIINPSGGQEVFEDTLRLIANVEDDTEIDRVLFSVQGKVTNGPDSAIAVDSPYVYLWDFVEGENSYGMVDIFATAWDTAGNEAVSPLVLINRKQRSGLDTLAYCFTSGDAYNFLVPDTFKIKIEAEEDTTRTLISDISVIKFVPGHQCFLKGFRVLRENNYRRAEYDSNEDYWLIIYSQDEEGKPDAALDSVLVEYDPLYVNQWLTTEFADFANLNPETLFDLDNPILVGIRSNGILHQQNQENGIALRSIAKPVDAGQHLRDRLFRHNIGQSGSTTDSTWTPLWTGGNKKNLVVPFVSAIVEYQE